MKNTKSQASFEYMLVIGIMFFGVIGAVSFLLGYLNFTEKEVSSEKINEVSELINKHSTEAFYSTGIYKKELSYQIPKEVNNIYTYRNTENTSSFIVFETKNQNFTYALNTVVCANFSEGISSGRIIIEKGFNNNHVSFCTSVNTGEKCSCSFFKDCILDGKIIGHGLNDSFFEFNEVSYGGNCDSLGLRSCNDGVLGGNESYKFSSCVVLEPLDCIGPNDDLINHGSSKLYYESEIVPFGETCQNETRNCYNGSLSGSYTKLTCEITPQDITPDFFNFENIDSSLLDDFVYSEIITPSNYDGPLEVNITGDGNPKLKINSGDWITEGFMYLGDTLQLRLTSPTEENTTYSSILTLGNYSTTWNVRTGFSCNLPWGEIINHSENVTAFNNSSVPCGSLCINETRTCDDGVLNGSFTNQSCSVVICESCTSPCGNTVIHGETDTCYERCSTSSETRTCDDGSWNSSFSSGYTYSEENQNCNSCTLPWGGTISHGQSTTAYHSSSVPCGSSCTSQTRTCNDGTLSGSYDYQSCSVQACASCSSQTFSWGSGCSASISATNHGNTRTISNTVSGYTGSARYRCNDGSWTQEWETCSVSCTPQTCSSLGYSCGSHPDGCGGTLNCGGCNSGYYCESGICKTCTYTCNTWGRWCYTDPFNYPYGDESKADYVYKSSYIVCTSPYTAGGYGRKCESWDSPCSCSNKCTQWGRYCYTSADGSSAELVFSSDYVVCTAPDYPYGGFQRACNTYTLSCS
ncbi:MAG: hypothetical protein ACLFPJ_00825 [Candidatus Woesearchaeota archaeon]